MRLYIARSDFWPFLEKIFKFRILKKMKCESDESAWAEGHVEPWRNV